MHPVETYVSSFYDHVPLVFWVVAVTVFAVCASAIIFQKNLSRLSMVEYSSVVLLNSASVVLSPYICGVFIMNGGDLPTHVGMLMDIDVSGHVDFELNFYPLMHLLAFSESAVAGLDFVLVVKVLAPYFSLLLPVYIYLLARFMTMDVFVHRVAFLIGSTFYLSSLFQPNSITTPNGLSLMFIPFLVYLFFKNSKGKVNTMITVFVCLTSFTFFHPLSSLVVLGALSGFLVARRLRSTSRLELSYLYFCCASSGYLVLLTSFWTGTAKTVKSYLLGYNITPGYAVDIEENLSRLGLDFGGIALLFFAAFGHQLLLMVISLAIVFFGLTRVRAAKILGRQTGARFVLLVCFFLTGMLFLLIALALPVLLNISFFRFLAYALVFTPLLVSFFVGRRIRGPALRIASALLVIVLFVSSILVVYPSPYISQANSQITYEDLAGSEWIYENKAPEVKLSGYLGKGIVVRLISGIMPYSDYQLEKTSLGLYGENLVPDHLGYDVNLTLWSTTGEETYIVITDFDIVNYQGVYSFIGRITDEDICSATNDYSVSLVYDNGGLQLLLTQSL